MKVVKHLDYLQFSTAEIPEFLGSPTLWEGSPLAFYRVSARFQCGARAYIGNNKTTKYLIQMPGQSCERWEMKDYPARIQHIITTGGTFSRVDLAVTVDNVLLLSNFRKALHEQKIISRRFENSEAKIISDAQGATETVYLGDLRKRAKKGVFRAYDKGKESALLEHCARFELESRRKQAHTVAKRFAHGIDIGDLIRQVVDIPTAKWWKQIMGAKSDKMPYLFNTTENDYLVTRWRWLTQAVAPALGRLLLIEEQEGTENLAEFNREVERHYRKAKQALKENGRNL